MPPTAYEIKARLDKAVDQEGNVLNMETVLELVSTLEKLSMTTEALEATRIGRVINTMRKKTSNDELSKRLKKLLKKWQTLVNNHLINPKTFKSDSPIHFASAVSTSASGSSVSTVNGSTKKHDLLDVRLKKERPASCSPDSQMSRSSLKRKRTSAENSPLCLRPISSPQLSSSPRSLTNSPKMNSSTVNFRPITPKIDHTSDTEVTADSVKNNSRSVDGEQVSPDSSSQIATQRHDHHSNNDNNVNITKSHDTRLQENRISENRVSTTTEDVDINSDYNNLKVDSNNGHSNESEIINNNNYRSNDEIIPQIIISKEDDDNVKKSPRDFSVIEEEDLAVKRTELPGSYLSPGIQADGINGTYSNNSSHGEQENGQDKEWFGWLDSIPKRNNELLLLPYVILD